MKNRWDNNKKNIESLIENYNGYIQIIFLVLTFAFGIVINKLNIQDVQMIILELIILISLEMIVINIKDSMSQRKLNRLLYHQDQIKNTIPFNIEEGYHQFPLLLSQVNNDLFISGMTCDGIWNHISTIEELLKDGHHIRILISSESAIESNAQIYHGLKPNKEMNSYINDMRSRINITLNTLNTNEVIKSNFGENFEVKRTDIPFTIACVGINIYSENNLKKQSSKKQLKVAQYITGNEKDRFPNMIIDSKNQKNYMNIMLKH